jgi:hypothetical protein
MYSKKKGKKGQWAQLQMQKKNRSVWMNLQQKEFLGVDKLT